MGRAPCCDKANVKRGPWSPEEDAKLKAYIEQNGTGGNWIALPQKIGLKRCGKSCRLRWLNYLRPNIKHGGFSDEEDNIICSLYISIGSRWSIIAAQLPGRTDNDIKNYWNTRLKKKLLGRRKDSQARRNQSDPQQDPINPMDSQTLSNSALERLQLHMQLQSIQHPFSFYNNPALWPKLHPLMGQKTMQLAHHEFNDNLIHQIPQTGPYQDQESLHELPNIAQLQRTYSSKQHHEVDRNSINGGLISSSDNINGANKIPTFEAAITQKYSGGDHEQFNENIGQSVSSLQAELKDLLVYSKTSGFEAHTDEFDYFKEMDWANDFDTKSSSSNSWDSASVVQPDHGLFQDYVLAGYDL